jgi:Spy/CpxP family protein refolding chaperone
MSKRVIVLALLTIGLSSWVMAQEGKREGKDDENRRAERRREFMKQMEERGGGGGLLPGGMEGGLINRLLSNENLVKELGLTQEQMATLKKATDDTDAAMTKLREAMEQSGKLQAQLLLGETVDENALMEAVEKGGKIWTEMAKLRVKQLLLLQKTLTKEQIEKLKTLRAERQKDLRERLGDPERRKEMMKRWGEREKGEKGGDAMERMKDRWGDPRKKHGGGEGEANKPGMENFQAQ